MPFQGIFSIAADLSLLISQLSFFWYFRKAGLYECGMSRVFSFIFTVFDLITAYTPISAQSSNSVVFRIQSMYVLSTSL